MTPARPIVQAPRRDWLPDAICQGHDPELFFPLRTRGPAAQRQAEVAKEVCARCPVRAKCLLWALETGQESGVWGGVDETELRRIRQRAARARRTPKDPAGTGGPRPTRPAAPAVGAP